MARLLLIEDDEILRELISMPLEIAGHTVDEASDGSEGLSRLLQGTYDIVILDMLMPKMDGLVFLDQVTEREPDLPPIIVLSATDVEGNIEPFLEKVRITTLRKPANLETILKTIDSVLGG